MSDRAVLMTSCQWSTIVTSRRNLIATMIVTSAPPSEWNISFIMKLPICKLLAYITLLCVCVCVLACISTLQSSCTCWQCAWNMIPHCSPVSQLLTTSSQYRLISASANSVSLCSGRGVGRDRPSPLTSVLRSLSTCVATAAILFTSAVCVSSSELPAQVSDKNDADTL